MDLTTKEVLTFKEACQYTGMKEAYMYKLTSRRIIPHSKPRGGKLYFSRKDLNEWMLDNPVKTQDQIKMEAANNMAFNKKKSTD